MESVTPALSIRVDQPEVAALTDTPQVLIVCQPLCAVLDMNVSNFRMSVQLVSALHIQ